MVAVVLPLPETDQSIRRPVVVSIVNQLITDLQFPPGIDIVYPAEMETMPQPGSTLHSKNRNSLLEPATRLTINVEEKYGSSFIGSNPISRTDMKPIFSDLLCDVHIKPTYTKTKMTLSIKYSDVSRNAILQWRDMTRMRLSTVFDTLLNHVEYHYLLPKQYVELLHHIHKLQENQGGYGKSFSEYIAEWSTDRITQVSTLIGDGSKLAIREKQIRMLGLIEFEPLLELPEIDQDGTLWSITFEFKFNYMKPMGAIMTYPLLIHNQLLEEKYVIPSLDTQVDRIIPETASQVVGSLRGFEIYRLSDKYTGKNKTLKLPYWDDWYPETFPTYTYGIVDALCLITPDDLTSLLNLNNLDNITLDPYILQYFGTEYPYLTQLYKSFYHLELYENNTLLDDSYLTVDSNLNVSSLVPLDIRKRYHVRLSIIVDFAPIYRAAFDRIRMYPNALIDTVKAINSTLKNSPTLDYLRNYKQVSIYDMYQIYRYLTHSDDFLTSAEIANLNKIAAYGYLKGKEWTTLKSDNVQFNTVMTSYIVAEEGDQKPVPAKVKFRS